VGLSKVLFVLYQTLADAGMADHMDIYYNIPLDFGPNILTSFLIPLCLLIYQIKKVRGVSTYHAV
jgi:hypothetical protein